MTKLEGKTRLGSDRYYINLNIGYKYFSDKNNNKIQDRQNDYKNQIIQEETPQIR